MTPDYWQEACRELAKRDRVMKKLIKQYPEANLRSRGNAFSTAFAQESKAYGPLTRGGPARTPISGPDRLTSCCDAERGCA